MEIGEEWIINYIKEHGTKIIIPKEAKYIMGIGTAVGRLGEYLKDGIEIGFEEGSQIEEILGYAFSGCKVKNKVVIPKNIKKIGYYAFLGCASNFCLEKDSELVECNDPTVLFNENTIDVPPKLRILRICNEDLKDDNPETLLIPEQSETKRIIIDDNNLIRRIKTTNGDMNLANDETFKFLDIRDHLYYLIYQKQFENKETKDFLSVIDQKTLKEIYKEQLLSTEYSVGDNNYVVALDNIWSCDFEKIPQNIYVYFKSDENVRNKDDEANLYYDKGLIYTIDEIREIKEKLQLMISKINVPPEGIKDREKIIYAQIVKQVNQYLEYDHDTVTLTKDVKYYNENLRKQSDETQNLKGLLNEKTVCKGFATIVQSLCTYYNIDCKVLANDKHAWNLVKLDGENYEDDFTWYQNDLQTSNILGMSMFLKGKDTTGKREFERLEYHETDGINVELSESLEKNKRFHLLTTDWSLITDWENVNIDRDIGITDYMGQIRALAKCKESMCMLANKKIFSKERINLKTFCEKIVDFFRNRGNKDDER